MSRNIIAFSYYGKTPVCWISTKLNIKTYKDLLNNVLIDYMEIMPSENAIFQQDNAAMHRSRETTDSITERNIRGLLVHITLTQSKIYGACYQGRFIKMTSSTQY